MTKLKDVVSPFSKQEDKIMVNMLHQINRVCALECMAPPRRFTLPAALADKLVFLIVQKHREPEIWKHDRRSTRRRLVELFKQDKQNQNPRLKQARLKRSTANSLVTNTMDEPDSALRLKRRLFSLPETTSGDELQSPESPELHVPSSPGSPTARLSGRRPAPVDCTLNSSKKRACDDTKAPGSQRYRPDKLLDRACSFIPAPLDEAGSDGTDAPADQVLPI
ncbi:hypothetical protein BC832DRAFT_620963 [Gaertneriomyces semiglobifer]|nr:hypothetical protein BC832DRAFT_620963 [Gaertneriomyces semiglobifer]